MSLLLALTQSTGYTLTADAGSYSISGVAATIARNKALSAGSGAYTVTGVAATVGKTIVITAEPGSYIVTGSDAVLARSGGSGQSYAAEIELKRWYVKRGKRIHVFSTGQDADAFLDAEQAAQAAVEQAQKTSRRARKRLRERILNVDAPPLQTVEIDALAGLVDRYSIPVNLPELLAQQDYERVMQIMVLAMQMQDEDDVEMLLLC